MRCFIQPHPEEREARLEGWVLDQVQDDGLFYLPDRHTVVAGHGDDAGSRHTVAAAREVAAALFARMLDADEHGPVVGVPAQPGDFAFPGADHEAADFTAQRITDQHLVITHAGKAFLVGIVAIGLNPQSPAAVKSKTIR